MSNEQKRAFAKVGWLMIVCLWCVLGMRVWADLRVGRASNGRIGVDGNGRVHLMDNSLYAKTKQWLTFDKAGTTQQDLGPNNTDATVDGATWATNGAGSYYCDGTNDFINLNTNANALSNFSFSCDILLNEQENDNNIMGYASGKTIMRMLNPSNMFTRVQDGSIYSLGSETDLTDASWHQITMTWDLADAGIGRVYVDGIEKNDIATSVGTTVVSMPTTIYIGGLNNSESLFQPSSGYFGASKLINAAMTSNQVYREYLRSTH